MPAGPPTPRGARSQEAGDCTKDSAAPPTASTAEATTHRTIREHRASSKVGEPAKPERGKRQGQCRGLAYLREPPGLQCAISAPHPAAAADQGQGPSCRHSAKTAPAAPARRAGRRPWSHSLGKTNPASLATGGITQDRPSSPLPSPLLPYIHSLSLRASRTRPRCRAETSKKYRQMNGSRNGDGLCRGGTGAALGGAGRCLTFRSACGPALLCLTPSPSSEARAAWPTAAAAAAAPAAMRRRRRE